MERISPRGRVESERSRETEPVKDVAHSKGELIKKIKFGDTGISGQVMMKKAAGKDMAMGVWVPAKAKFGMTIEPIIQRIVEVVGSRQQAMHWLGTPVRALDFATPISMLATKKGVEKVMDVLGQMEHGVW
jgi:hypothetical protein